MFWVIQENLKNEIGFDRLLAALLKRDLPFTIVQVIPFSHDLAPEPVISTSQVIVSGSTTLSEIALERGWKPGPFLNGNFDFPVWQETYRGLLLNEDAEIDEFGHLKPEEPIFLRPCSGNKTFAGRVIDPESLQIWQNEIRSTSDRYSPLTPETAVLFATPKRILQELRFFIVDRQVVTGSIYRTEGHSLLSRVRDGSAWTYAEQAARLWQPDRAFVLDIALTSNGPKIIEINSINSAGFYDADLEALVDALENSLCTRS